MTQSCCLLIANSKQCWERKRLERRQKKERSLIYFYRVSWWSLGTRFEVLVSVKKPFIFTVSLRIPPLKYICNLRAKWNKKQQNKIKIYWSFHFIFSYTKSLKVNARGSKRTRIFYNFPITSNWNKVSIISQLLFNPTWKKLHAYQKILCRFESFLAI